MKINIKKQNNYQSVILRLEGELDMKNASKFKNQIIKAFKKTNNKFLILNLKKVNFIDSTGLGVILGRYKVLSRKGGGILLVGMKKQVRKIFSLAGMLSIMHEFNSEEKALNKIKKREEIYND
ncbi:MAG: STAS domain-containing protein [Bacillota bacterium]